MAKPALPTLIKLAQQRVEQAQAALGLNQRLQADNRAQHARWQAEAAQAFANASTERDLHLLQAATAFTTRATREQAMLDEVLRLLRDEEAPLRAALQAAFTEQKRYELLADRQAQAAHRTRARKAQETLDDLTQRRGRS